MGIAQRVRQKAYTAAGGAIGTVAGAFDAARKNAAEVEADKNKNAAATQQATLTQGQNSSELETLNTKLANAICKGYGRTANDSDVSIRSVVCSNEFIMAIEDKQALTPLERVDTSFADGMDITRKELATKLRGAQADKLDVAITSMGLELIYTTLVSPGATTPNDANPNRNEWQQTFFAFVESTAQLVKPGEEGAFIGTVLKDLGSRATMTDANATGAQHAIADQQTISNYLQSKSEGAIGRVIDEFGSNVTVLLTTPETELCQFDAPGIGHAQWADARKAEIDAASEYRRLQNAKTEHGIDSAAIVEGEPEARQTLDRAIAEFNAQHSVETRTRQIVEPFKHMLHEWCESKGAADELGNRMALMLVNHTLIDLLAKARKTVEERDSRLGAALNAKPSDARTARQLETEKPKIERAIGQLALEVDAAPLPETTKIELRELLDAIKNIKTAKEPILKDIEKLEAMAKPLMAAATTAVEKLNKKNHDNLVGITDTQWAIARAIWDARKPTEKKPTPQEGSLKRIWHFVDWHLFTGEAYKEKFAWTYQHVLREGVQDLKPSNWFLKVRGRKPDGTPYDTWMPRVLTGIITTPFRAAVTAVLAVAIMVPVTAFTYGIIAPFARGAFTEKPAKHLTQYWTWPMTDLKNEIDRRFVIDDSYDDPAKLATRGHEYYRRTYGITNEANVAFLTQNPDILRFLQERVSGRWNVQIKRLGETPETCAEKVPSKSARALGLKTNEEVTKYEPQANPAAVPGNGTCCLIEVAFEAPKDIYVLNRYLADGFVAYLQQAGVDRGLGYHSLQQRVGEFTLRGFVITKKDADAMKQFGITKTENLGVINTQGTVAAAQLLPLFSRGEQTAYVLPEFRDAFVANVRKRLVDGKQGDVAFYVVSEQAFRNAVWDEVKESFGAGKIENCELEYGRMQVVKKFPSMKLGEISQDVLWKNQDIMGVVEAATKTGMANLERADELVQLLAEHKKARGKVENYAPGGKLFQSAVGRGILYQSKDDADKAGREKAEAARVDAATKEAADALPKDATATAPTSAAPQTLQLPKLELRAEEQVFFSNKNRSGALEKLIKQEVDGLYANVREMATVKGAFGEGEEGKQQAIIATEKAVYVWLVERPLKTLGATQFGIYVNGGKKEKRRVTEIKPDAARVKIQQIVLDQAMKRVNEKYPKP